MTLDTFIDRVFNARWKVITGYAVFTLLSFIFWLYVTFPYQAVRDRVTAEAARNGWTVTIGSLGPGLFGITARDVELKPGPGAAMPVVQDASLGQPGAPRPPMQLTLQKVSARPALFPPGVTGRANAFGGVLTGSVGLLGNLRVRLSGSGLDPADATVKSFSGIDAEGKLDGEVSLNIPAEPGRAAAVGLDLSHASGVVTLSGSRLLVKGGTVTVPYYGQPTPFDLPRIALGEVDGRITFEDGKGKVEHFAVKSDDLQLTFDGGITLGRRIDFSELNLTLRVKAQPEFLKRVGLIGSALSMLPPDKTDPSFRATTITGYLGSPKLMGLPR